MKIINLRLSNYIFVLNQNYIDLSDIDCTYHVSVYSQKEEVANLYVHTVLDTPKISVVAQKLNSPKF